MSFAKLTHALANPSHLWYAVRIRLRGLLFKIFCALFRPRVSIGRGFMLDGRMIIRGPGRVIIGDNVHCGNRVTPFTYDRDAVIRIGNRVQLNGTRFGCKKQIEVGDNCILAEIRIMDTDFHSVEPNRRNDPKWIKSSPIKIEENVWIAADCIILKGVRIGKNSTISPASVVGISIPESTVAGGNPAKILWHVDPAD
jgi:acetyltransferase-like isoleucine patch superfamily enzyme